MKRVLTRAWPAVLLLLLGGLAYAGSFGGVFVFDDYMGIVENPKIRDLAGSVLVSSRPLTGFTFHLNYLLGGLDPTWYHAVNLSVHLAAGLLLFGLVRRTLSLPALAVGLGGPARLAAFVAAAFWLVHPLQTESVTYISQRAESMTGMFYLLTLYAFVRAARSPHMDRWYTVSIVSCALGMATKPSMVTAPVLVLLFDRAFLGRSLAEAWRARRRVYLGLAATWLVPAALCTAGHESVTSVGFAAGMPSPLAYLATQPGVILRYLRLSFWPTGQCLDYEWPIASSPGEVLLPGIAVIALAAASVALFVRGRPIGFLGLAFLVPLLPTSSVVPIADAAAEHRMYLSLAPIAVIVAQLLMRVRRMPGHHAGTENRAASLVFIGCTAAILGVLGVLTVAQNRLYASDEGVWRSVVETSKPPHLRARLGYGAAVLKRGRHREAQRQFAMILEVVPNAEEAGKRGVETVYAMTHNNLGVMCQRAGAYEDAARHFREALSISPQFSTARRNLQIVLDAQSR